MAATVTVTQYLERPSATPVTFEHAIPLSAVSASAGVDALYRASPAHHAPGVSHASLGAASAVSELASDPDVDGWNLTDDTATFCL